MHYTDKDYTNIEIAKAEGGKIWENTKLKDFKRRLKNYFRIFENEQCCYCKKNFIGEFNMVIDIEHILPKSDPLFKDFMFTLSNLNISCKRCNMEIKKARTDFLFDKKVTALDPENSAHYKFIHPNFDKFFDHLDVFQFISRKRKLIKYSVMANSEKGQFNYTFFRLNELEVDSMNQAQGMIETPQLSLKISREIEDKIRNLLKNGML